MRFRKVSDHYFIRVKNKFVRVKAIPMKSESLDLFIHPIDGKFAVTEASSGGRISKLHPSRKKAKDYAQKLLENKGEGAIRVLSRGHIGSKHLSPRYRFIANPTRKNVES